jgi:hypothetical protein
MEQIFPKMGSPGEEGDGVLIIREPSGKNSSLTVVHFETGLGESFTFIAGRL